jgi:cytidine deaminase
LNLLQKDIESLIEAASAALRNAHAPYSGFRVGAAILAASGKTYTGCNIENSSLTLTVCAERVALLKCLSEGEKEFKALALVCEGSGGCYPCGSCRQMLFEFAPEIKLIIPARTGTRLIDIRELLPYPFVKE